MKRYLPLLLFLSGTLLLIGTLYFFVLRKPASEEKEEEEGLQEVSLIDRPVASLTPTEDGHWLKLRIEKLLAGANSLDYELLYTLPDGRTQGVPGAITLKGESEIERDLLLGSESSGKFRYDEGVETGTLTLRFRNEKGKLLAKFSTKFHLQSATRALTSADDKLTYTLGKIPTKTFFVTMETFGIPGTPPGEVSAGPYGIFSSGKSAYPGSLELSSGTVYVYKATSWTKVEEGESSDIGIFIAVSE
ncbi:hypothetical protein HY503_01690 [Candidatus Woesebacteria bacterium]|nr:hypothetical protein [Candidatus Woesebacteria bacterium]